MAHQPTIPGEPVAPTPLQGLLILLAVIGGVIVYLALSAQLRLASPYAGFLFIFYWTALKQADPREFASSLLGALGGVLLAWLLHILPPALGTAGLAAALVAVCAAIYALVMGWLPRLVNNAMMLLLTVGTIDAIQRDEDFAGMAGSILLAAALAALPLLIARVVRQRRGVPPTAA